MRKPARLLKEKAVNSLVLAVEHFNRPHDRGRVEAVLIFLNHSFEMLLKAAILHKGGKIREKRQQHTIGFDASVRRGLSDASVKFLTEDQALTLQTINGLRDAAEHHFVELSESQLYLNAQAGLTLFRDIYGHVFGESLHNVLPTRVLPISTTPPTDLIGMFENEMDEIRRLLAPRTRRRIDAKARLRGLAIIEGAVAGEPSQPSDGDLDRLAKRISSGEEWQAVFPGVSSLTISKEGDGPTINLRISKKEGVPIQIVKEGEGRGAVAIKRVNELDFYSLGFRDLLRKSQLKQTELHAILQHKEIQKDDDCFKTIKIGSQTYKRYSPKALDLVIKTKSDPQLAAIVAAYKNRS